jgi:hypothetical protein
MSQLNQLALHIMSLRKNEQDAGSDGCDQTVGQVLMTVGGGG